MLVKINIHISLAHLNNLLDKKINKTKISKEFSKNLKREHSPLQNMKPQKTIIDAIHKRK